ncbi:MAG: divergent polysaccharide deacetylase family protein [Alphaproteobacteria bacterium]
MKVSFGKGLLAKINALLIWRVLLVLVLLANIALGAMLWMSGGKETAEANASGRRLLYTLADGKVEGRQVTSEELAKSLKPEAANNETAEKSPEPEVKPAAEVKPAEPPATTATTEPAATTEPEQKAPEAAAENPPAEVKLEESPVNNAETSAVAQDPNAQATAPDATAVPAEPVPAPADAAQVPSADAAQQSEPTVELPAQAPVDETQANPVSPEAPVYNQALPPVPADTSSAPSLLPEVAPTPPLKNQSAPAIKPTTQKLPDANPLIAEKTSDGNIPVVAQDGTKAWRYYAKPFTSAGKQPMIAIIITGLGHNKLVTEHAIALSENITLSFSPYAREVEKWGASARLAGHEVMLDLPVEPANFPAADPGPYGLLTSKPPEENEGRLRWLMSRVPTSIGFVTPRNERYTASVEHMKLLLQSFANRGLMVVLTRDTSKDETKEVLANTTATNLTADFIIDEDMSDATIKAKLASMEQLATQRGFAVGIAQPYPLTIAQLKIWLDSLSAKGIVLVPVSAIAKQNFS